MQDAIPLDSLTLPADLPSAAASSRRRVGARVKPWFSTLGWAAAFCVIAQTWFVQGYEVYGCCMEPNLKTGERVLGAKIGSKDVQRGDVIVFRPPLKCDTAFIKRVVGMPGDVLEIRGSRVFVNGAPLNEPYLRRAWHDDRPPERVPAHMFFVMGDNRDNSNDSRTWGELPLENIQAKAWVRYWPLNKLEWIR